MDPRHMSTQFGFHSLNYPCLISFHVIWWTGSLLEELLPRVASFFPAGVSNRAACQVNTRIGLGRLAMYDIQWWHHRRWIFVYQTWSFLWMMLLILFIPSWPLLRFAVRPATGDINCRALKSFITIEKRKHFETCLREAPSAFGPLES